MTRTATALPRTLLAGIAALLLTLGAACLARADPLDDAWAAIDAEDWQAAETLATQMQATAATRGDRHAAQEVLATLSFYTDDLPIALAAAETLDRAAIAAFGPESPERLVALSLLGWLYSDTGQTDQAIAAITRAIRIGRTSDQAIETTLGQMLQLAQLYLDNAQPRITATLAAEVELRATVTWGAQDLLTLEAQLLRAWAHLDMNHPVEARLHLGPILQNLALVQQDPYLSSLLEAVWQDYLHASDNDPQTDQRWAEAANQRAAKRAQQDDDSLALQEQIAAALADTPSGSQPDRVEPLLRRATALSRADDPTAIVLYLLGLKYQLDQGDLALAQGWGARIATYPAGYLATLEQDLATPLIDLAVQLSQRGYLGEVGALADLGLSIRRLKLPPNAIELDHARAALADILISLGQTDRATRLIDTSLAALTATNPDPSGDAATLTARVLLLQSELAQINTELTRASQILESILRMGDLPGPEGGLIRYDTLSALATVQMRQGAFARAVPLLEESRSLAADLFGAAASSTETATATLAVALFESGQTDRALALYNELMTRQGQGSGAQSAVSSVLALIDLRLRRRAGQDTSDHAAFELTEAQDGGVLSASLAEELWFAGDRAAAAQAADQVIATNQPGLALNRARLVKARLALARDDLQGALTWLRPLTQDLTIAPQPDPRLARMHLALHADTALRLAAGTEDTTNLDLIDEAVSAAQWSNALAARTAFDQAALRWQTSGALSEELRLLQDARRAVEHRRETLRKTLAAASEPTAALAALDTAESELRLRSNVLRSTFPDYATAADPAPIALARIARALHPDEALLIYMSSDEDINDQPASQLFAVTAETVQTAALPAATDLRELAQNLRCAAALTDLSCPHPGTGGGDTRGSFNMPSQTSTSTQPAFDFALGHQAYQTLIAPVTEALQGKTRLIIVPDAALIGLPFNLLLTTPPEPQTTLASADWLIRDRALRVMPTVSAFITLRQRGDQRAPGGRFLGVGDPLIGGQTDGPLDFDCALLGEGDVLALNRARGAISTVGANAVSVTQLSELPDSRCELRRSARAWPGAHDLLLHGDATETRLQTLNRSGALRDYAAITFATHGLVAGEIGAHNAGLVLTPSDNSDGLLTTAEVAQLDLDAQIVILSACNTAAGSADNAQGLSGLASAFFYAGARSLMVSSWPVYSDAAVQLSSGTLDRLGGGATPEQALRLTILALLNDPNTTDRQRHPAYWAPFFVAGGL